MRIGDIILLTGLFVWLFAALRFLYRQKKRGGCAGCGQGSCTGCQKCGR